MLTLYGIKNCDTVKKARKWLEETGIDYCFHDYRTDGIDAELLSAFSATLGWESLLNTRGTTWRKLDDADKQNVDEAKAIDLMVANDALVKRPVWQKDGEFRLGFAAKDADEIKAWASK
jgi:Spx/MgsR family transcriptional regulator